MTDKRKQLRVGLFAIVAAALVAVVLIAFGGMKFWRHRDHYFVVFDKSVMGLTKGAHVYLNGIEVGSVEHIALDRADLSRVRVDIAVDRDTPIRADGRASLSMAGITGLKVIDLEPGSLVAPPLPPGGTIVAGEGLLDRLEKRADSLADQTGVLMERTGQLIDSANRVMAGVAQATDPAVLRAIVDGARRTSDELARASRGISAMIADNRVALHRSLDAVTGAATSTSTVMNQQVAGLVDNANALVGDLRGIVHGNEAVLQATTTDLRHASRSFKELARELRDHPSRLLFSADQPDRKLP
ncbi:MAG TPA: MlaD family protein [Kofleriaceae bacterium]|nr:MlaD family protein [Kofleriaceae bacterium]